MLSEDFLSLEEWHTLMKATQSARETALLWLLGGAGLRVSEAATLKVEHLDNVGGYLHIVNGKGGKQRTSILPMPVLEALQGHLGGRDVVYIFEGRELAKRFIVRIYYITCMKGIWLVLLILMTTGICTAEFPYLVGNWTGSQNTYVAENGSYKLLENQSTSLVIVEQKDRLFTGYVTYPSDGKEIVENLAGAISLDNKTFHVAELNEGYDIGTIISDDEIELIYLADGENGRTVINTLYRIKE